MRAMAPAPVGRSNPTSRSHPGRGWLGGGGRAKPAPPPRVAAVDPARLPPLHAPIELHLLDGTVLTSRVMGREPGSAGVPLVDFLDAPRSRSGGAVTGWALLGERVDLQWGHEEWVEVYPAEVSEVLDPMPALEVRYLGPPTRRNRRKEPRSAAHVRVRLEGAELGGPLARGFASITRDISPSGVRVFTPDVLETGQVLSAQFILDDEPPLIGTVRVLRCDTAPSVYRGYDGVDVVLMWDPALTGAALARWALYCRRHRWDY